MRGTEVVIALFFASAIGLHLQESQDEPHIPLIACVYQREAPRPLAILNATTMTTLERACREAKFDLVSDSGIRFAIQREIYSANRYSRAREVRALAKQYLTSDLKDSASLPHGLTNRIAPWMKGRPLGKDAVRRIESAGPPKIKLRYDLDLELSAGGKTIAMTVPDHQLRAMANTSSFMVSKGSEELLKQIGDPLVAESGHRGSGQEGSLVIETTPSLDDYRMNSLVRHVTDLLHKRLTTDRSALYADMKSDVDELLTQEGLRGLNPVGSVPVSSLSTSLQVALGAELNTNYAAYGFATQSEASTFLGEALVGVKSTTSGLSLLFHFTSPSGSFAYSWHIRTFEDGG
jgi:hypothetical protein